MQPKTYFIVAISLPAPGTFLALHHHAAEKAAVWAEEDTERYQGIVSAIRAGKKITNHLTNEVLADPEKDGPSGSLKVLPYLLEIVSSKRPVSPFLDESSSTVMKKSLICSDAIRPVILNKVPGVPTWAEDIAAIVDRVGNDIIGRSSHELLEAVANHPEPVTEGLLQLAVVPGGIKVSLGRNSQGEFVREVPKTWA